MPFSPFVLADVDVYRTGAFDTLMYPLKSYMFYTIPGGVASVVSSQSKKIALDAFILSVEIFLAAVKRNSPTILAWVDEEDISVIGDLALQIHDIVDERFSVRFIVDVLSVPLSKPPIEKPRSLFVGCIDSRLHPQCREFFASQFGESHPLMLSVPGGAAQLSNGEMREYLMGEISRMVRAYHLERVVLLLHDDCRYMVSKAHLEAKRPNNDELLRRQWDCFAHVQAAIMHAAGTIEVEMWTLENGNPTMGRRLIAPHEMTVLPRTWRQLNAHVAIR